jgi:predicted aspartyl protease
MIMVLTAATLALGQPTPSPVTTGPAVTRLEATGAPAAEAGPAGEDVLQLDSLPDLRLTVGIDVGGKGPFRFLVDTAADRSAVSRQLAARLKLAPGRDAVLHSVTGVTRVSTASLRGMRVASRNLPDVNAPLLDARHVGADGILGTDVLRSAMVRFDFRQRLLSITQASRNLSRAEETGSIVVEARRRSGRLIVTEAELDRAAADRRARHRKRGLDRQRRPAPRA